MSLRKLSKRLTPYLTAYLLLVSIGVPLNRVYCACVGESWLSVLPEEHACHHDTAADVVYHEELAQTYHGDDAAVTDCTSHDCGNSQIVLPQLDVDFTTEWFLSSGEADVATAVLFATLHAPVQAVVSGHAPIRGPTPPPAPYGRDLLARQQIFLI
ncbi:hypothetical protein [Neolewinella antarctica]|uniref:Uncharacterized protein n=1 Tax=Neolewinella antarctica TaxID=442734 RepID=A0ABX0X7X2_9BACT|nr:hypothetical protein [Neolewinella antarctica]NJC25336.1 hypothetical protein [Neolewinella antarctica]